MPVRTSVPLSRFPWPRLPSLGGGAFVVLGAVGGGTVEGLQSTSSEGKPEMDTMIKTPELTPEVQLIADEVDASRQRIREVDAEAYGGFVTDAACYAVARRRGMKATDVLRAWRAVHPRKRSALTRWVPPGIRQPSDAAKAVA